MVLKKSKLGRNTGNSFYSFCYKHHINRHGCIAKFLLNDKFTNEEREEAAKNALEFVQDGGLSCNWEISDLFCDLQSLNKRKRWMLAESIKEAIDDQDLCQKNFRIVLHERSLPQQQPIQNMMWDRLKMKTLDTIGYHDSRSRIHHSYAKSGKLSSLSDLKMSCHGYSPKHRANFTAHGHTHGIQRMQDILSSDFHQPHRDEMPSTRE